MRIAHIFLPLLALALLVSLQGIYTANAQEQTAGQLEEEVQALVQLDEGITAEELNVSDPTILPNSPFYFLKNARRGVQNFFTFDRAKRAELKLQFASERIVEAQKLASKTADQTALKDAVENYSRETEEVKKEVEKISDKTQGSRVAEKILDAQIKHHKILGAIMREYGGIAPEIEQTGQDATANFAQSAAGLLSPEELQEKLPEIIERQRGSQFREFKNLEVLNALKDAVPEQAKPAIQHAIQQASKNFEKDFAQANEPLRDALKMYIEKTGGNEVRRLEVLDTLKSLAEPSQELNDKLNDAREKMHEQVEKRFGNIGEEERKHVFISHLERGSLENMRTLTELGNNLSSETLPVILEVKQKSEQRIREKFEQAQSTADLQTFFTEIEQKSDVRMMTVVRDITNFLPENKQELAKKLERRAFDETRLQVEKARRGGVLEDKLRSLSGNDPEDMEALNEFRKEFPDANGTLNQLDQRQAEHIKERFEVLRKTSEENPGDTSVLRKTDSLRLRVEQNQEVETKIKNLAPSIVQEFKKLDTQEEKNISPEHVQDILREAEHAVEKLSLRLEQDEAGENVKNAARRLLQNAKEKLARARAALDDGKTGMAFGQANAALHDASNGLKMLEKRGESVKETEAERTEVKELPGRVIKKENILVEPKKADILEKSGESGEAER